MTDHMKTTTSIVRHDAHHLVEESARVLAAHDVADPTSEARSVALSVWFVARGIERLASATPDPDAWQTALADETFDRLLQTLRITLERVDPARQAAA